MQGQYQVKPKLPFIPGAEVSGKVIEIGKDVRTVKVGDLVTFQSCNTTQLDTLVSKHIKAIRLHRHDLCHIHLAMYATTYVKCEHHCYQQCWLL